VQSCLFGSENQLALRGSEALGLSSQNKITTQKQEDRLADETKIVVDIKYFSSIALASERWPVEWCLLSIFIFVWLSENFFWNFRKSELKINRNESHFTNSIKQPYEEGSD
jgi:hypothetical protein